MIHLYNEVYLRSDPRNLIISEWNGKVTKDGKPVFKNERFYSTTEGMLKGLHKRLVREGISGDKIVDIVQLRRSVENANEIISNIASALDIPDVLRGLESDTKVFKFSPEQ